MNVLAYPLAWAYNRTLRQQARRWQRRGLLTPAQLAAFDAAHPLDYYRPPAYVRALLFVFSWLGLSSVGGFWAALTEFEPFSTTLVGAVGYFVLLEVVIRHHRHYGSGLDNALLYAGLGSAGGAIGLVVFKIFPDNATGNQPLPAQIYFTGLPVLALLSAAAARYADRLVAASAYLLALALLGYTLLLGGGLSKALLPFGLMLAAAGAYAPVCRLPRLGPLYCAYADCALVLEVLALATFYLAGNYYVVREGNAALANLSPSPQIPFAPLFYFFTAAVPPAYIALGLRERRRVPLLVGVLALAFSIFTLRYYRAVLPPEIAATAAGAALIALAALGLRYLRPQRHGLTSLPDDEVPHFDLESLLVAQTAAVPAAPEPSFEFGGGQSGGGGATGAF